MVRKKTELRDFGDGKTGTKQNPTQVYEYAGTNSVSLAATNGVGSDTLSKPDNISTGSCDNPPVREGIIYYSTMQEAYDIPLTSTGDIIEGQTVTFLGDVALWRDITVTFAGGNNCEYADQAMGTTINGLLTVSKGTVIAKNLIVK